MTNRGREARLKPEYATLYPGIEHDAWIPVELVLRLVTDLVQQDRKRAKSIMGTRLLREEHFDFRGSSERPEGLPEGLTRLSDSGAPPSEEMTHE